MDNKQDISRQDASFNQVSLTVEALREYYKICLTKQVPIHAAYMHIMYVDQLRMQIWHYEVLLEKQANRSGWMPPIFKEMLSNN